MTWTDLPFCSGDWDVNLDTMKASCHESSTMLYLIALLLAIVAFLLWMIYRSLQPKKLTSVRISWRKNNMPVQAPLTLNVGQKSTATLQGFDQFGNPIAIDPATITWTDDNEAAASDAPQADGSDIITGAAAGVSNLTGSVKRTDGVVISSAPDAITVQAPPVLTTVQISLTQPQ